jgi:hypothetical protein
MKYNDYCYQLPVSDGYARDGISTDGGITTGCYVFVYTAGTKTLATIYSDGIRTAKTNPISRAQFATDGMVTFYGAATSYDLVVCHSDGRNIFYPGVTPNVRHLVMSVGGSDRCIVFPMLFNSGGTVVDTGIDLPYKAHVYDLAVEVVDVDATETVDIGLLASETAGDEDGLVAALSVATAGFVKPYVNTTGSNETYVSSAKFGALMGPSVVGTDVDKDDGVSRGWGHVVDGANAKSLTYTPSTSDTFTGYGYVYFKMLR